jgi:hypothetical protein
VVAVVVTVVVAVLVVSAVGIAVVEGRAAEPGR